MLKAFKSVQAIAIPGSGIPDKEKCVYNLAIFSEEVTTLYVEILNNIPRIDTKQKEFAATEDRKAFTTVLEDPITGAPLQSIRYKCRLTNPANNVVSEGFIHACDIPALKVTNGKLTLDAKMQRSKPAKAGEEDIKYPWVTFGAVSGRIGDHDQLFAWFEANEGKIFKTAKVIQDIKD